MLVRPSSGSTSACALHDDVTDPFACLHLDDCCNSGVILNNLGSQLLLLLRDAVEHKLLNHLRITLPFQKGIDGLLLTANPLLQIRPDPQLLQLRIVLVDVLFRALSPFLEHLECTLIHGYSTDHVSKYNHQLIQVSIILRFQRQPPSFVLLLSNSS